ncbi:MAG: hydroxymethylglutaryl-CoA lyase, partial [Ferruginibacter sp.]
TLLCKMENTETIKIIECPRDSMQGWPHFIPTQKKIEYINALISVGFNTIDFGSFVSPKAIPQMADTAEVLKGLLINTQTSLLAIIANLRGAREAVIHDAVAYLGYPFSISETFQLRNTGSSIKASFDNVKEIQELCVKNKKSLVVYLSMGFGNPFGDPYHTDTVTQWMDELATLDISIISIADTVGLAQPEKIHSLLSSVIPLFPLIEVGVHLHSTKKNIPSIIEAALTAGCRRFDGAIKGIGGCPMAGNELVGNIDTEMMIQAIEEKCFDTGINKIAFSACTSLASSVFEDKGP